MVNTRKSISIQGEDCEAVKSVLNITKTNKKTDLVKW